MAHKVLPDLSHLLLSPCPSAAKRMGPPDAFLPGEVLFFLHGPPAHVSFLGTSTLPQRLDDSVFRATAVPRTSCYRTGLTQDSSGCPSLRAQRLALCWHPGCALQMPADHQGQKRTVREFFQNQ